MSAEPLSRHSERVGRNCTLWVNDSPNYRPADHGYGYVEREMVVAVSFVSRSGRAWRVSFDPVTGEPSTHELRPETPDEPCDHDFQWHPQSEDFGVCSLCGADASDQKQAESEDR